MKLKRGPGHAFLLKKSSIIFDGSINFCRRPTTAKEIEAKTNGGEGEKISPLRGLGSQHNSMLQ